MRAFCGSACSVPGVSHAGVFEDDPICGDWIIPKDTDQPKPRSGRNTGSPGQALAPPRVLDAFTTRAMQAIQSICKCSGTQYPYSARARHNIEPRRVIAASRALMEVPTHLPLIQDQTQNANTSQRLPDSDMVHGKILPLGAPSHGASGIKKDFSGDKQIRTKSLAGLNI
jgi:hypothetical protein